MNVFVGKGSVGAGAGGAAFLLVALLIKYLVRSGALKPADRDAIFDEALGEVPATSNANYDDARSLLKHLKG